MRKHTIKHTPMTWSAFKLTVEKCIEENAGLSRHSPVVLTDGCAWFSITAVACGPREGELMVCLEELPACRDFDDHAFPGGAQGARR